MYALIGTGMKPSLLTVPRGMRDHQGQRCFTPLPRKQRSCSLTSGMDMPCRLYEVKFSVPVAFCCSGSSSLVDRTHHRDLTGTSVDGGEGHPLPDRHTKLKPGPRDAIDDDPGASICESRTVTSASSSIMRYLDPRSLWSANNSGLATR